MSGDDYPVAAARQGLGCTRRHSERATLAVSGLDVGGRCRCKDPSYFDKGQTAGLEHLRDDQARGLLPDRRG